MSTVLNLLPDGQEESTKQESLSPKQRLFVQRMMGFVEALARTMAASMPHTVDVHDVVQDGMIGLMDAARRFDESRGIKFETFAERRVRGAIVDALRKDAWPRGIRKFRRNFAVARDTLRSQLKGEPSMAEIAAYLGKDEVALERWLLRIKAVESTSPVTRDEDMDTDTLPAPLRPREQEHPDVEIERREMRDSMFKVLGQLPTRDRKVLLLYYYCDLTMKEIGRIVGVNESRVSQLHYRGICRLRQAMAMPEDENRRSSMRGHPVPPMWRPRQKSALKPKALVVGLDYFALTSRVDTQVVFWSPDQAKIEKGMVPSDITILWLAEDLLPELRADLLDYAIRRDDVEVWTCDCFELRDRLLPIWGEPRNRSLVEIVEAGESAVPDAIYRTDNGRISGLKEANDRFWTRNPTGPQLAAVVRKKKLQLVSKQAPKPAAAQIDWPGLDELPILDRKVFLHYAELADLNGDRFAAVAKKTGLSEAGVRRIIQNVAKLMQQ